MTKHNSELIQHWGGATLFIVEDDVEMQRYLMRVCESMKLPVTSFATGEELLDACSPQDGGCVLLDMRLPGMSGLQVQAELERRGIGLPVIFITGYAEVATAVAAVKAGAVDFLLKPVSPKVLLGRIQTALKKDAQRRREREREAEFRRRVERLTQREQEVMNQLVAGKANKVIAADIGISEKTVETHRKQVMLKMGVGSFAELVGLTLQVCGDSWVRSEAHTGRGDPRDPNSAQGMESIQGRGALRSPLGSLRPFRLWPRPARLRAASNQ